MAFSVSEGKSRKFSWGKGEFTFSQCAFCKHNRGKPTADLVPTCQAYPNGVPNTYINNEQLHSNVQKDQVGDYVFSPTEDDLFKSGKLQLRS